MRFVLIFSTLTLLVSSCSKDTSEQHTKIQSSAATQAQQNNPEKEKQTDFDSEGRLRESGDIVAGLRLPRTLSKVRSEERLHVYESSAPLEAIQHYFGQRLLTGVVERRGQSATFKAAVPKGVRGGIVKMDVWIQPISPSRTRIEIQELRPAPENQLNDNDVRSLLRKEQKHQQ